MKLTIEVPTPRFKIGDIVKRPNQYNDGHIILCINQITYSGTWRQVDNHHSSHADEGLYVTTIQEGRHDYEGADTYLRPGQVLCPGIEELDCIAELIPDYPKPIITPDTAENIITRLHEELIP